MIFATFSYIIVTQTNAYGKVVFYLVSKSIGKNITMYREMRELTKVDLAKRTGVSPGSLSHLEKGTRAPSVEMLYKIADALNVSVLNLVMDQEELNRFYYDEQIKASCIGSEKLLAAIEELKRNSKAWAGVSNVAIVNLDELEKDKL